MCKGIILNGESLYLLCGCYIIAGNKKNKQLGIHYTQIASDDWYGFITGFKNCKQSIAKFFTVGIEGNNCKIRHRIRRDLTAVAKLPDFEKWL